MATKSNLTGPRRSLVEDAERDRLQDAGGLVVDARRKRPRYFDGRFLAARDLTNDQQYTLTRQADLGRAAGWGTVEGLMVTPGARATEVRIGAGLGVTPAGETVLLPSAVTVDLLDLRTSQLLDAHLGLRRKRTALSRARTGAFVLALRPVEYTANPRRGYPTDVQGDRRTEDHDIVEATAITLVPWPQEYAGGADAVRRQLVRDIFVTQSGRGLKADLLPLAMVYLDGVAVRWIDPHLVRRPIGAEQGDVLGLGLIPRAVRNAHIRQYGTQLREIVASAGGRRIVAAQHFDAIPPVGEVPVSSIDPKGFSQGFFPAAIDVDLSLIPEDELPGLVEESLMLPPIDLHAPDVELTGVSVLILVPVERSRFREFKKALATVRRPLLSRVGRLPVVRTPLLALSRLKLPQMRAEVEAQTPPETESSAWTAVFGHTVQNIGSSGLLWYARRRNLNYRAEIEGFVVDIDVTALGEG